jgi:hypothetical protein
VPTAWTISRSIGLARHLWRRSGYAGAGRTDLVLDRLRTNGRAPAFPGAGEALPGATFHARVHHVGMLAFWRRRSWSRRSERAAVVSVDGFGIRQRRVGRGSGYGSSSTIASTSAFAGSVLRGDLPRFPHYGDEYKVMNLRGESRLSRSDAPHHKLRTAGSVSTWVLQAPWEKSVRVGQRRAAGRSSLCPALEDLLGSARGPGGAAGCDIRARSGV